MHARVLVIVRARQHVSLCQGCAVPSTHDTMPHSVGYVGGLRAPRSSGASSTTGGALAVSRQRRSAVGAPPAAAVPLAAVRAKGSAWAEGPKPGGPFPIIGGWQLKAEEEFCQVWGGFIPWWAGIIPH